MTPGVAIVGCGGIGRKRRDALGAARLVACADTAVDRARALAAATPGAAAFDRWQDASSHPDVDIVIVATTNDALTEVAIAALQAGKHVLVEKPAARTVSEVDRLIEAERRHGRRVRVGFNHRYHPGILKARALVERGALGPLMFVRGRYGHGGRIGYDTEWRANPAISGGGELIDQGVHLIDLSRWFLGEFSIVDGHAATMYWRMPVDDNAFLTLRTPAGQVAFLHVSCSEWKNLFSLEIYGRDGKIAIDGLGGSYGVERVTFYEMTKEMGPPVTTAWEFPQADRSWSIEFEEFLDDVRLGRTPSAGLEEARAALVVVEKNLRALGISFAARMIIARSPLRITLGGGGTDLPSYYREHTGFLIAAAIDRYVFVTVMRPFAAGIFLKYSKLEHVEEVDDVQHPIIREAIRMMGFRTPQVEITTLADIPAGTGLGSSGSFTTALLRALYTHRRRQLQIGELAELACEIEINRLREPVGKQDQYIAAYGGVTCFTFYPDEQVKVEALQVSTSALFDLEDHLLLFFTGFSRSAGSILVDQKTRTVENDAVMIENLHQVKALGLESRRALEQGDTPAFGALMHEQWEQKKRRSGGMSNSQIDEWYELGRRNGALGGKLVGAGGGGFLLFYAEDRIRLRAAMAKAGVEEVRFRFDFEGTKVLVS